LFAGLPGVGKSTISRKISQNIGARVVDIDDFKKESVDPTIVTSQIDPPEVRWAYYQKAFQHVCSLFAQGVSIVIMDEVFHLGSLRTRLETLCQEQGIETMWVEVKCPYEIVKRRLQATKREGHILSAEEALKMYLMFRESFEKFPTDSQNHIILSNENDSDVHQLIENILRKG
jgi:predicted kinase